MSDAVELRLFVIGWPQGVAKPMQDLFYKREHGNLIFHVDGRSTRAHARIFFANATFGRRFLRSFLYETELMIDFCTFPEFLLCLKVIYGHQVKVSPANYHRIRLILMALGVDSSVSMSYSGSVCPLPRGFLDC